MIPSDYLIYAVGAETQTFGIPDVKEHACFMKKIRRNSSQVAGYWDQDQTHFSSTSTNAPVQITCSPLLLWSTCKHYKVISFPLVDIPFPFLYVIFLSMKKTRSPCFGMHPLQGRSGHGDSVCSFLLWSLLGLREHLRDNW